MIKKIYFHLSLLACFILLIGSSCSKNEPRDINLILSTSEISFPSNGGTRNVSPINNSYIQNADCNESWINISYYGASYIIVSAYPNPNSTSRRATIICSNEFNQTATISVTQEGSSNSGGGNNPGSGGNDNTGGGNNDNTGGGNGGGNGGGTQQKPSAPTGVRVSNEGNNYIPDVRVRWNSVSNATSYYIYKSSSASGSYSKIGETSYPQYGFCDTNAPTNGKSAYYKVKAVNSAGESAFSDYAKYTATTNDEAFSPAYTYGNCSVSGTTITLRWTNSTGYGYGKATKVVLRVWNPYSEEWQDTQLSASATSASFNYSNKVDSYGYVKAGIVVSNDNGSFTAGAKIYDAKNKKWLN